MLEDGNEKTREVIAAAKKRIVDAILDQVKGAPFCSGTRTETEGLDSIRNLTQQLDAIERCEQFYGKPEDRLFPPCIYVTEEPKERRFKINGIDFSSKAESISYEEIVEKAGMTGTPTMTARSTALRSMAKLPPINVLPGDTVPLVDGLVINVMNTGNA